MNPDYTLHHPRWHRGRMPIFWWLQSWRSARFITRELTSVFVGLAAVVLLLQVRALARGPEAYARFEQWLRTPLALTVHALVLLFVLFHAVTWFNLSPRAMVLKLLGRRIPGAAILAANYLLWIAASGIVLWFLVGG